tara:strand:- start:258 stop:539 length:282 start_codon:yes stop_codon:yes gene_type:complete
MKTINFKGKGEHSVNELELIIEQQAEELHLIKSGQKQLILSGVSSSYAVQKVHFYSMISTYLKASEEVENGIYDPIEDALQEIQQKYLIIQKA